MPRTAPASLRPRTLTGALACALAGFACLPGPVAPDEEGLPPQSPPTLAGAFAPDAIAVARGPHVLLPVPDEEPAPEEPAPEEPAPEEPAPEEPACPRVQVVNTGGLVLNVRPAPSTAGAPVGALDAGAVVDVVDVVEGESVNGDPRWYGVEAGEISGFISAAFASCDIDPVLACPRVQIVEATGAGANVRPTASTAQTPRGVLPSGAVADVLSIVDGEPINGESTWYEVSAGDLTGFVSGALASCDIAPAAPESAFLLPLACGSVVTVTQGNNTNFSHSGSSAYAFDFSLALNTPLVAIQRGVVIAVDESTQPGHPCYSGGGPSCINDANIVTLRHPDGTTSLYAHVNSVSVSIGQSVQRGEIVALSGGTGYSTGPHAHVQRQTDCGFAICQSIPVAFADVAGDGVPVGGEVVTSENGCF